MLDPSVGPHSDCDKRGNPVAEADPAFRDHMDPSVRWIEDPNFELAFQFLTGDHEQEDIMVAFTKTEPRDKDGAAPLYPGFINIRFEAGKVVLTVRGDPAAKPIDKDADPDSALTETQLTSQSEAKAGETVQLILEQHDWDQFVAEATRERGLVPGG